MLTWNDVVDSLRTEFDVVRFDLRGLGYSARLRDNRYAVSDQVQFVREAMERLQLTSVVLFGHSYGGGVTLMTYLHLRDDPRAPTIVGLGLIDAASYPQSPTWFIKVARNALLSRVAGLTSAEWRTKLLLKRVFAKEARVTPERVRRHARFLKIPDATAALEKIAERVNPPDIEALVKLYPSIRVPTLIVWGGSDPVIPVAFADSLEKSIPGSRKIVLDQVGHAPQEEEPGRFLGAVFPFLREVITGKTPL